jgi:DDE superfamily endonuclease
MQLDMIGGLDSDARLGHPFGVTPSEIPEFQRQQFQRDQRYQILPAYAQDGILLSSVFQGLTELTVFENFIRQLLPLCGRWPQPKSVFVMEDVPFHHTERIEQMCYDAGVKIVYLPPCSVDLNPVESFLAELRRFMKLNWQINQENPDQGFDIFLQWCLATVGSKGQLARHHFRKAGVRIKAL